MRKEHTVLQVICNSLTIILQMKIYHRTSMTFSNESYQVKQVEMPCCNHNTEYTYCIYPTICQQTVVAVWSTDLFSRNMSSHRFIYFIYDC